MHSSSIVLVITQIYDFPRIVNSYTCNTIMASCTFSFVLEISILVFNAPKRHLDYEAPP